LPGLLSDRSVKGYSLEWVLEAAGDTTHTAIFAFPNVIAVLRVGGRHFREVLERIIWDDFLALVFFQAGTTSTSIAILAPWLPDVFVVLFLSLFFSRCSNAV